MQTFRHHLRPHEDITLVIGKGIDDILIRRPVTRRVQIHPQHACLRKERLYLVLNAFRTKTDSLQLSAAGRTHGRNGHVVAAIMASQLLLAFMPSHRYIALHTSGRLAARGTLDLRRVAATVLKENDLFPVRQHLTHSRY